MLTYLTLLEAPGVGDILRSQDLGNEVYPPRQASANKAGLLPPIDNYGSQQKLQSALSREPLRENRIYAQEGLSQNSTALEDSYE